MSLTLISAENFKGYFSYYPHLYQSLCAFLSFMNSQFLHFKYNVQFQIYIYSTLTLYFFLFCKLLFFKSRYEITINISKLSTCPDLTSLFPNLITSVWYNNQTITLKKLGLGMYAKYFFQPFAIFMECHKWGIEFASVEFFMRHKMRKEYMLILCVLWGVMLWAACRGCG